MDSITNYSWLLFFIVAYFLLKAQSKNWPLIVAFSIYGVMGFISSMERLQYINYSTYLELAPVFSILKLTSMFGLLIGGIMVAKKLGSKLSTSTNVDNSNNSQRSLFTPINETNTLSRGQTLCAEACSKMVALAKESSLDHIAQHSHLHSPDIWFRIDYQLPSPAEDLILNAFVFVKIERFDYHRIEHTYTIITEVGKHKTENLGVIKLDNITCQLIHEHISSKSKKLKIKNRIRQWPWELWRPHNKVDRIGIDWIRTALIAAALLAITVPIVGIFLAAAVLYVIHHRSKKRHLHVLTSGKPGMEPRDLLWMDSWQSSVESLGCHAVPVKEGIISRLESKTPERTKVKSETLGNWGLNDWIEREQIVVSHRRALGFIRIIPYGDVLYVAWECHLNSATWVEDTLKVGIDKISKLDVTANRVVLGTQKLTEYDVSDSNFLSELIHDIVRKELKLRMAEHKIDQEIDFTVQHESRSTAFSGSNEAPKKKKKSLIKRLG